MFPGLFSGRLGVGVVEESMGPSEMQCTCLGGLELGGLHAEKRGDNRQKKFLQVIL